MKAKELREKTVEELRARQEELKKELFNIKIQNATGQGENHSMIKKVRRNVARVKTIIAQKERGLNE